MATRKVKLKATSIRQAKAKKRLYTSLHRLIGRENQTKAIADAINELYWANLYHFLTYISAK